jgi:hypothetical protein
MSPFDSPEVLVEVLLMPVVQRKQTSRSLLIGVTHRAVIFGHLPLKMRLPANTFELQLVDLT